MPVATLTTSALAGGRVFPAGTAREGEAAEVIPAGDWWSDYEQGDSEQVDESADEGTPALFDPAASTIPQVLDHLGLGEGQTPADAEEVVRVLDAERGRGEDARKTLVAQLEEALAANAAAASGGQGEQD